MSNDRFTIRTATVDDLAGAARLAAELVRLHHDFDPQRFGVFSDPIEPGYERFLRGQLDDDDAVVLIAEDSAAAADSERIVGYLLGGIEPRNWMTLLDRAGWIHDVFVAPVARRHGVAVRLVEDAIARLRARGVPRVVLNTATKNLAAQELFARLGFRPTMVEMTREVESES